MALTKLQKDSVVESTIELLNTSKLTVITKYETTTVKELQELRKIAKSTGTTIKVVKNRLFVQALKQTKALKDVDVSQLTGMLMYAFNPIDEVAPAKSVADFAKNVTALEFVGAITSDGKLLTADKVKELASLPSKEQLIAQVVATLLSPVNDTIRALSGDLHGLLDGLASKAN